MEKRRQKKRVTRNKPIIILASTIILLLIFCIVLILINKPKTTDDNLKYNRNKSFTKQQKINGIAFKNINCTYDGENSLITYTIINETNSEIYLNNYDILVRDKNKNIITKIVASYLENLPPKKEINMANSVIGTDLSNAYYMELKLKTSKK